MQLLKFALGHLKPTGRESYLLLLYKPEGKH